MADPVVVTGADGFLGWHVRAVAHAAGLPAPVSLGRDGLRDETSLAAALDGADRVVHLAGVNRGRDDDVRAGNVRAADTLARALRSCTTPPKTVVFANSIQAGNGTSYGDAKAAAAEILADATRWAGSDFVNERLPNLFGEHGRPHYNSVVATFCHTLAAGGTPEIRQDHELELLHVTDAAAALLGIEAGVGTNQARLADTAYRAFPASTGSLPVTRRMTVREIEERLRQFASVYRRGEIPALVDRFDVRLFNTYRSHCFPEHYPMGLVRHGDARGELVETVRVHGGGGQTFCSSTRPGITRGEHYHLAKIERFVVVSGDAEISLRRLLGDEIVRFRVSGSDPVAVDMPTMWVHNITNVGDGELVTLFWSNDLHDPTRPDTYPEKVSPA